MAINGISTPFFPTTSSAQGGKVSASGNGPVAGNGTTSFPSLGDTFVNGNSAASQAAPLKGMQQQVNRRVATDAQVNRMTVTKGPASATPADAAKIREELSKMDPTVLKSLADKGTSIRVLGTDDNLFEAGLLRPIAQEDFAKNFGADQKGMKAAQTGVSAKYDARIKAAEAEAAIARKKAPAPAKPTGNFMVDQAVMNMQSQQSMMIDAKANRLLAFKEKEIGEGIKAASGGRWMEFSPGALGYAEKKGLSGNVDPMTAQIMEQSKVQQDYHLRSHASLDQIATAHGIKDPKAAGAFKEQVYGMNKERIDVARQQATEKLTRAAAGTGKDAEQARKELANFKAHPTSLPIDLDENERPLLVPNQFGTTVKNKGKDENAILTLHDVGAYYNWSDKDGKANNPGLLGQYFYEGSRSEVVVRREELGKKTSKDFTLTHEVGHAVDRVMKDSNPKVYESFLSRLTNSHATATPFSSQTYGGYGGYNSNFSMGNVDLTAPNLPKDPKRHAVSNYAGTNPAEFLAEGYSAYTHDPERLKATDAKLFQLIREANRALGAQ